MLFITKAAESLLVNSASPEREEVFQSMAVYMRTDHYKSGTISSSEEIYLKKTDLSFFIAQPMHLFF